MTSKSNILLSLLLFSLSFSLQTKAAAIDQVKVAFFNNKVFQNMAPKCNIDPATKTLFISEIEPKCLTRLTGDGGQSYFVIKSDCSEVSVRAAVNARVNSYCGQNDVAAQARVNAARAGVAASSSGGSSGGSKEAWKPSSGQIKKVGKELEKYKDKYDASKPASEKDKPGGVAGFFGLGGSSSDKPQSTIEKSIEQVRQNEVAGGSSAVAAPMTMPTVTSDNASIMAGPSPSGVNVSIDNNAIAKSVGIETTAPMSSEGQAQLSDLKAQQQSETPAITAAAAAVPQAAQGAAAAAVTPTPPAPDSVVEGAVAKGEAEVTTFTAQIQQAIKTIDGIAVANAEFAALQTCLATTKKLEASAAVFSAEKATCSKSAAWAGKLCPLIRSPKALLVQAVMTVGAGVLSKMTSASESCKTTSNLSKVAQGGMLLAQLACTGIKFTCDASCAMAANKITVMEADVATLKTCLATAKAAAESEDLIADVGLESGEAVFAATANSAPLEAAQLEKAAAVKKITAADAAIAAVPAVAAVIAKETAPTSSVPIDTLACKKNAADIALMAAQVAGLASASKDAKDCEKKLASGRGGGGSSTSARGGPTVTTAEFCSDPSNANVITCKCTADPNAQGCIGSLAAGGSAFTGKLGNGSGASQMAGAGGTPFVDPSNPSKGLSAAAKEALGVSATTSTDSANNSNGDLAGGSKGGAGGGSSFGAGGNSGGNPEAAKAEKEKSRFGSFSFSGLSSLFGGSKNAAKPSANFSAEKKQEQEQAIKRKLASDQLRAEISTASGKSNFDKIKGRYQSTSDSLIGQ